MRSQSLGSTSSAGRPPANHPIGTATPGRDCGVDVDHGVKLDLGAGLDAGAVEHNGAGCDAGLAFDHTAGQVGVWPDKDVVTEARLLGRHAADDRVFHDHAVRADVHGATLGGDHGTEQHAAVRADGDIAGEHGRRCDVGGVGHLWRLETVLDEHRAAADNSWWSGIFLRTHVHHFRCRI
jgi:hypothetical protein